MTTTDLAVRATTGLPEKIEYATELAKSELLPRQYRDKPANILLVMEFGEYLGLPPVAALRLIHIIDNKPVASAELISGRVRAAGHRLRVLYDPEKKTAACSIWRADDPGFEFRAEWTWERASAVRDKDGQPLTAKANWRNYYPAMLKWRAVTECARDACPEILLGVSYSPDELGVHEITDGEADSIGVMTRHQRVEHERLRRMGEPAAGAVEKLAGPDPDDSWTAPQAPGPAVPDEKAPGGPAAGPGTPQDKPGAALDRAKRKFRALAFSDEEWADLIQWQAPEWPDRPDLRPLTSALDDELQAAGGDVESARSSIWTKYHQAASQACAQHQRATSTGQAGDGD